MEFSGLRIFRTAETAPGEIERALRPRMEDVARIQEEAVDAIVRDVRARGDAAVLEYVQRFDWPEATMADLKVSPAEFDHALQTVDGDLLHALTLAAEHIRRYHMMQMPQDWFTEIEWGLAVGQQHTPVESVACYVPTAKASLPSSLLMTVVPAQVAGVKRIVVTGPSRRDGTLPPGILAAAQLLEISEVYKLGSAWGIAALAYGTDTVTKVDKIVGPTNAYGSLAKKAVFGDVGIDAFYGPSEVAVIADGTVPAAWVAADLLSQAEHGEDSTAVLISPDEAYVKAVSDEVAQQMSASPRAKYLAASLASYGAVIITRDLAEAAEMANLLAAEHLELAVEDPKALLPAIKHAGSILMGGYSPVPIGDYLAGPSHVLPTGRTARFASGLGVMDFLKRSSLISAQEGWLQENGPVVETMAEHEGLAAHAAAVRRRIQGK